MCSSGARGEILTGFEIDLKITKSLRLYFHQEHSKVLKKKSGSSADEIYSSCWFAYKHMFFIFQGDKAREGKDTITLEENLWIFLSLSYIACTTDIYLAMTRVLHST